MKINFNRFKVSLRPNFYYYLRLPPPHNAKHQMAFPFFYTNTNIHTKNNTYIQSITNQLDKE